MVSPELKRKVSQHDNDIGAIYRILEKHGIKLNQITTKLTKHTKTLDQHTKTLDQHTKTLDQHTKTLADHGTKLDQILDLLRGR